MSYMWLCWEGFCDGLRRFASNISLKPEFPTFLANWSRRRTFQSGATRTFNSVKHFKPFHFIEQQQKMFRTPWSLQQRLQQPTQPTR